MAGTTLTRMIRGLGSLFLFMALAAGIARAGEQPGSPIRVEFMPGARMSVSVDSATTVARAVVGWSRGFSEYAALVKYEDHASFGPPGRGTGWLFRVTAEVTDASVTADLTLNVLVDATSGRVQAVFTDAGGDWVLPIWPTVDPEQVASLQGWVMGPEIPDSLQSGVVPVINACWRSGLDPRRAGQLVVRPRWIASEGAARAVGGKPAGAPAGERVWLVQVCGAKLNVRTTDEGETYNTGQVMKLVDGSLRFAGAFYVP